MTHQQAAALVALGLLVSSIPLHAQTKFSSRTLAVRVDVLVTDGRNPVAGLTAGDFELRDNGVLQHVGLVDAGQVPINAVLVLDTSASIAGRRRTDLIGAAEALLDGLHPVDRAALTTFNSVVAPLIPLTGDLAAVREALRRMAPKGLTAVMDGAYAGLVSTLDQAGRFLVVVCTDGADTSSWLQPQDVVETARRSNAVVYAVTTAGAKHTGVLERVAETTGGRVMAVKSSDELRGTFERILAEFRSRYVLAYSPEGVAEGGFHRIEVSVPRRRVTVKARPGYAGAENGGRP